jgi:hypothetical protein
VPLTAPIESDAETIDFTGVSAGRQSTAEYTEGTV